MAKKMGIMNLIAPKPKASSTKMPKAMRGEKMPKEERKVDRELERKG